MQHNSNQFQFVLVILTPFTTLDIPMKYFNLVLCLGAVAIFSGCSDATPPQSAADIAPPAVMVVEVQRRDINEVAEDVARTEATARVEIRAQVTGILKSRAFAEGSFVNQGDLLLEIDPAQFEADLAVAAAAVAHAKAAQKKADLYLARLKGMRAGAVAAVDLDAAISEAAVAEANLQQMEAQWKLAKLDLDHTRITAPISGRIGASTIDVGNLVSANGDSLATIVQSNPIEVSWSISERLLTNFKAEMLSINEEPVIVDKVIPRLRLSNGEEYTHTGEIFFVDNEVNPRTGTVTIRARFANGEGLLIPGQFVTALLQLRRSQSRLLIPQAAVQQDMQGYFVLVVTADNRVEQRHVELGNRFGTEWIVNQGLESGEWIVYQGLEKVRPGITVNPARNTSALGKPATMISDAIPAAESDNKQPGGSQP